MCAMLTKSRRVPLRGPFPPCLAHFFNRLMSTQRVLHHRGLADGRRMDIKLFHHKIQIIII
jgi:hypothetical protein